MAVDIDREWAVTTLQKFIADAKPKNGSGDGVITTTSYALCGREEAIRQLETVKPILERLYPDWRDDNIGRQSFEFAAEHDAAQKLIARLESEDEVSRRLGDAGGGPSLSASALHPAIWRAAEAQWSLGNYADAVDSVARFVNSLVQSKLGRKDLSDTKLVQEGFSDKDPEPGKPRFRYPNVGGEETQASMRRGVMHFGLGCFGAIRNPLAHLPDDEVDMSEQEALERLAAFSLFARWLDEAEVLTSP